MTADALPHPEALPPGDAAYGDPAWRAWGPYVSERQWGTVREDYGPGDTTWDYLPHDHARSRAYRWGEDGLAGLCDDRQAWCLALALWNGADPILKERAFGLTGPQGNHGEDVKEYWWYLDATPTATWLRWRYHYPQRAYPYDELVAENARRGRDAPEFELVDTGAFADGRYWAVTVDYAKATPYDVTMRVTVENRGPDPATVDVLPTLWFRNTWAWGLPGKEQPPQLAADGDTRAVGRHRVAGTLVLDAEPGAELLFCDNETNAARLFGTPSRSAYPKDGIGDHVVHGAATVNPARTGTKVAVRHRLTVAPGGRASVHVRLRGGDGVPPDGLDVAAATALLERRRAEADAFHAALAPSGLDEDRRLVLRQALAGMLWGRQFYRYDVDRWLDGDPAGPPPPASHQHGRNADWRHLDARDVISMPDKWEYPWFAAWDLAFHAVALAHADPAVAKEQLLLLCRAWYLHPSGQLPAYEWNFDDVNPPVHAWAALQVFAIDGARDHAFLEQVFHALLMNFTWWVNRKDAQGNNVFEGGFLGLDNIGPIDRSAPPPVPGTLEQSDGTAWMAKFCLDMLEIAVVLARRDPVYEAMAVKFAEHFAYISAALYANGLWDDADGFFYDVLAADDGRRFPLRVRSVVGLLPLCAVLPLGADALAELPELAARLAWFVEHRPQYAAALAAVHRAPGPDGGESGTGRLLALVTPAQLPRLLDRMLDTAEFLSPHGIRSLSAAHRDAPFVLDVDGRRFAVDYEPAESRSAMYGGNSNWRGPVWLPVNLLLVQALRRFGDALGPEHLVEHPRGSGRRLPLRAVADDLADRVVGLFVRGADGRRPVLGDVALFQQDPGWRDQVPFHEYFHGDTGAGLGAAHQTGWTGVVADLLLRR